MPGSRFGWTVPERAAGREHWFLPVLNGRVVTTDLFDLSVLSVLSVVKSDCVFDHG